MNEKCVCIVYPDGKIERSAETIPFHNLQEIVGGYVEVVHYRGIAIVCDEEGKLKGKPVTLCLSSHVFVGTVCIGEFTDNGLEPIDTTLLNSVIPVLSK